VVGARNDTSEITDVTDIIKGTNLNARCLESLEKGRKKNHDAAANP
jgi:hypothetical protein